MRPSLQVPPTSVGGKFPVLVHCPLCRAPSVWTHALSNVNFLPFMCRTYTLEVVQHPERSAEFGSAMLSRLPLSPPPIVQLTIRDQAGSPVNPYVFRFHLDLDSCSFHSCSDRNTELPFLVAHLHLHAEDGTPLDVETTGQSILYGSTVSSAQTLRNLQGSMGSFFVFPDVSVSTRGRYILRITLTRLPRQGFFQDVLKISSVSLNVVVVPFGRV